MKKQLILNKISTVSFILYFFILLTERIIALILSINQGGEMSLLSLSFFGIATYSITFTSVLAGSILFIFPLIKLIKTLFSNNLYNFKGDKLLIYSVIILLYSGMMHTGFTIAPIQFISYGFLILAMLLEIFNNKKEDFFINICSFIFITLFSMCIPVCYITHLSAPLNILFHIAEFIAVFILIPTFMYLFEQYFNQGHINFSPIPTIIMFILCSLVVGLKFVEEINYFVLIFLILTTVFYLSFGLICHKRIKAKK